MEIGKISPWKGWPGLGTAQGRGGVTTGFKIHVDVAHGAVLGMTGFNLGGFSQRYGFWDSEDFEVHSNHPLVRNTFHYPRWIQSPMSNPALDTARDPGKDTANLGNFSNFLELAFNT